MLAIAWSTTAHAGAWLQEEGKGLFLTQTTSFVDYQYYDRSGHRHDQPVYNKYEFQPYAEYGLMPNLTIGGTVYLQDDTQLDRSNKGIADPTIFARTKLWQEKDEIISVQPLLKFASQFEHDGSPRGGSGSTDAELTFLYGCNFDLFTKDDYLDLSAGYRFRSGTLNDQYHADIAVGLHVDDDVLIVPALRSVRASSIPNRTFTEDGDQDYDLLKVELGGVYTLNPGETVGLTAFDLIDGKQTGNGAGVTLSFGHTF